ncbi:MAG: hypothetical protein U0Q18_14845 [Bryobacteraceae bacterium]
MSILELKAHHPEMWSIPRAAWDCFFRGWRTLANRVHPEVGRQDACPDHEVKRMHTARERLAEAVTRLERIDAERERQADSLFGRTTENRIIWGELIELELQEIDEQINHICESTVRSVQPDMQSPASARFL